MPITSSFLSRASAISFANANDIDRFFTRQNVHDFISWFNANVANKGFWGRSGSRAGISMANDSMVHDRFNQLWSPDGINAIFGKRSVLLIEFLSLQSIINNETGGTLLPSTEKVGSAGHPGIAYAFDKIPAIPKRSYNTLQGNKTCLNLFKDINYNKAFGNLPLGSQLKNTDNAVWAGEVYPQSVPFSTNAAVNGYILEADFFKFRGRGFIQTTGRSNNSKIIDFIKQYQGSNNVINNTKAAWLQRSTDTDTLATISSNSEWDNLFQNCSIIPAKSIQVHNSLSENYLGNINTSTPALATKTIRNVGLRISGGNAYADLYINRVTQIIEALQ